VNALSDPGKLILAQSLNSLLDLFNAHTAPLYRFLPTGSCTAKRTRSDGEPTASIRHFVPVSVPLAKLQPGRYTCQVSVLDPSARKVAFWRLPMMLLP
jgi:hypothetical protein